MNSVGWSAYILQFLNLIGIGQREMTKQYLFYLDFYLIKQFKFLSYVMWCDVIDQQRLVGVQNKMYLNLWICWKVAEVRSRLAVDCGINAQNVKFGFTMYIYALHNDRRHLLQKMDTLSYKNVNLKTFAMILVFFEDLPANEIVDQMKNAL